MGFIIRLGKPDDIQRVHELIHELAIFERAPEEHVNTPEQMLKDGFGENPLYGLLVAEMDGIVEGISLYYYRYSTWKGKCLYLEDLIITEIKRGLGMGKALFEATVEVAKNQNCNKMVWQVLDWNTPALDFYKTYGCSFDGEWINCMLNID